MEHREGFYTLIGQYQVPVDLIAIERPEGKIWAFAYANLAVVFTDKTRPEETLPLIRDYLKGLLADQASAIRLMDL